MARRSYPALTGANGRTRPRVTFSRYRPNAGAGGTRIPRLCRLIRGVERLVAPPGDSHVLDLSQQGAVVCRDRAFAGHHLVDRQAMLAEPFGGMAL